MASPSTIITHYSNLKKKKNCSLELLHLQSNEMATDQKRLQKTNTIARQLTQPKEIFHKWRRWRLCLLMKAWKHLLHDTMRTKFTCTPSWKPTHIPSPWQTNTIGTKKNPLWRNHSCSPKEWQPTKAINLNTHTNEKKGKKNGIVIRNCSKTICHFLRQPWYVPQFSTYKYCSQIQKVAIDYKRLQLT